MVATEDIRRITRGLYDLPRLNTLTKKQTSPDPSRVIGALAWREQARMLVDGVTAADDLGLSVAAALWFCRTRLHGQSPKAERARARIGERKLLQSRAAAKPPLRPSKRKRQGSSAQ
jgi:hypothetical protein